MEKNGADVDLLVIVVLVLLVWNFASTAFRSEIHVVVPLPLFAFFFIVYYMLTWKARRARENEFFFAACLTVLLSWFVTGQAFFSFALLLGWKILGFFSPPGAFVWTLLVGPISSGGQNMKWVRVVWLWSLLLRKFSRYFSLFVVVAVVQSPHPGS